MKLLILCIFCLTVAATTEPNEAGQCGEDKKVTLSTTIINNATVEDGQVIYIEGTEIVYIKVTQLASFKSDVYRSADSGKTWTKQTTPEVLKEYADEGIIRIFSAQPNKKEERITLYLLSYGNKMWVTSNGGLSYDYYNNVPSGITNLITHDLYPGMALAKRAAKYGEDHELLLVTEFGKTWEKLLDIPPWSHFAWSKFPKVNPQRIYLQLRKGESSSYESHSAVLVYSDDRFKTRKVLPVPNVYYWFMYDPDRIVAISCVEAETCSHKRMYISEDAGASFHLASFPDYLHETKNETGVFPYEVSDDVIWTFVNRYCQGFGKLCYGDLYHSYAADKEFTLSLRYLNPRDFTKYRSLDGIYVANQYITVDNEIDSENDIRTLITFNKGGTWNVLLAPDRDSNNQPTNCFVNEGCSLHLHGYSDYDAYWDFFYSVPNAVGVMLASGNIGRTLQDRQDQVNLYYSRDGGMKWQEVRRGRYITEIGNHGTAILAARIAQPTNKLIYNIDDGDSWIDCLFANHDIDVKNIRVSSDFSSTKFLLYGHKDSQAFLVHVDLTNAYTGKCGESDFEIWSPKDVHGECFMGHHTQYQRRAVGKKCFLDIDHVHLTTMSNCSCSAQDYECSECFYRPTLEGQCQLECDIPVVGGNIPGPAPGYCDKSNITHPIFYEVDIGYELVDEDTCDPSASGSVKPKAVISCEDWKLLHPPSPFPIEVNKRTVALALIFVLFMLVIGGGSFYLWKTNERFYSCISNTFGIKSEERDLSYSQVYGQTLVSSDDDLDGVKEDKLTDELSDSSA